MKYVVELLEYLAVPFNMFFAEQGLIPNEYMSV